jgi:hypothetical protein
MPLSQSVFIYRKGVNIRPPLTHPTGEAEQQERTVPDVEGPEGSVRPPWGCERGGVPLSGCWSAPSPK